MTIDKFREVMNSHDVVVLFFFKKKFNFKQASMLASPIKSDIKNITNHRVVTPKIDGDDFEIDRRRFSKYDLCSIHKDIKCSEILYVFGLQFTAAIYILKRK